MTAADMVQLSKQYGQMADRLQSYLEIHPEISDEEFQQAEVRIGELLKQAETLSTDALDLAMKNAAIAMAQLQTATVQAVDALKHINQVQRVLTIAGAAVQLGVAVMHPTPGSVLGAVQSLVESIRPPSAEVKK